MCTDSLNRPPTLPVCFARSLPARSQKWNMADVTLGPVVVCVVATPSRPPTVSRWRCSIITVKMLCERLECSFISVALVCLASVPTVSSCSTSCALATSGVSAPINTVFPASFSRIRGPPFDVPPAVDAVATGASATRRSVSFSMYISTYDTRTVYSSVGPAGAGKAPQ